MKVCENGLKNATALLLLLQSCQLGIQNTFLSPLPDIMQCILFGWIPTKLPVLVAEFMFVATDVLFSMLMAFQ